MAPFLGEVQALEPGVRYNRFWQKILLSEAESRASFRNLSNGILGDTRQHDLRRTMQDVISGMPKSRSQPHLVGGSSDFAALHGRVHDSGCVMLSLHDRNIKALNPV